MAEDNRGFRCKNVGAYWHSQIESSCKTHAHDIVTESLISTENARTLDGKVGVAMILESVVAENCTIRTLCTLGENAPRDHGGTLLWKYCKIAVVLSACSAGTYICFLYLVKMLI